MPASCPDGWQLFSIPSTPDGYEYRPPPTTGFLTGVTYRRFRTGTYEWVSVTDMPEMRGSCGQQHTFTTSFAIEQSSSHSVNIGAIFNLGSESREVTGGYQYTWGSASSQGTSIEQTVGPTAGYEYMAKPIVLQFTICYGWVRDGTPWYELVGALFRSSSVWIPTYAARYCDRPLFIAGGLMICRRWCGEGSAPGTTSPGH